MLKINSVLYTDIQYCVVVSLAHPPLLPVSENAGHMLIYLDSLLGCLNLIRFSFHGSSLRHRCHLPGQPELKGRIAWANVGSSMKLAMDVFIWGPENISIDFHNGNRGFKIPKTNWQNSREPRCCFSEEPLVTWLRINFWHTFKIWHFKDNHYNHKGKALAWSVCICLRNQPSRLNYI